jgi:tRNA(Ile)-lysidine synthase
MNELTTKISDFLSAYNLLQPSKTYLIGFSGGYDSLCLVNVLNDLSKEYGFKLVAAHLNHNWRGGESQQEEIQAKQYCEKNNIIFYSQTLSSDLPKTETEARNQRYIFFEETAQKYKADAIFTGHTKTDNVETVIYRILKGTGVKGLKGIPATRLLGNIPVYRPMLDISREETISYCSVQNLEPNVDSSNENICYQRNKIRLNLIPQLKEYNLNLEEAILKLSAIASENEEIVNEYISQIQNNILNDKKEIDTAKFMKFSPGVRTKIVKNLLESENIEYDYKKIHNILDFLEISALLKSGNTISVTTDKWLFVSSKIIKIIYSTALNVVKSVLRITFDEKKYYSTLNSSLIITTWQGIKPDKFPQSDADIVFADFSDINEPLYIRTRQSGDRIIPFGATKSTKLKKYLINKGIPEHERDNMLLLTTDKEVLWVAEVGISEKLRVKNTPTHTIELIKG